LATGAEHVNDIAIYSLPNMEPVASGYNAHSYWIFDIVWLDDEHVVSGAGDNRLALWTFTDKNNEKPNFKRNSRSLNESFSKFNNSEGNYVNSNNKMKVYKKLKQNTGSLTRSANTSVISQPYSITNNYSNISLRNVTSGNGRRFCKFRSSSILDWSFNRSNRTNVTSPINETRANVDSSSTNNYEYNSFL
jgi:hypothetical protein